jgi:hypothetical protein
VSRRKSWKKKNEVVPELELEENLKAKPIQDLDINILPRNYKK